MANLTITYRTEREQALAALKKAEGLVKRLVARPDHVPGSPPGEALGYMADAISMLRPDRYDTVSNGNRHRSFLNAQE